MSQPIFWFKCRVIYCLTSISTSRVILKVAETKWLKQHLGSSSRWAFWFKQLLGRFYGDSFVACDWSGHCVYYPLHFCTILSNTQWVANEGTNVFFSSSSLSKVAPKYCFWPCHINISLPNLSWEVFLYEGKNHFSNIHYGKLRHLKPQSIPDNLY